MKKKTGLSQFTVVLLAGAMLAGCGSDAQKRYDRATEALKEARDQRQEAQARVEEKQKELKQLRENLDTAEERLIKAREIQEEARAKVRATVNDEVLFRTIQRKMLEEDEFGDSAIAVGVADRVVTLTGTVPDEATHKEAIKTAKRQSGVEEVVDFLEVEEKKKPEPKSE